MKALKPACEVFKPKKFKKASEALTFARSILSKPGRWIEGALAGKRLDEEYVEHGVEASSVTECKVKGKDAQAFCALGAVQFVNGPAQKLAEKYLRNAALETRVKQGDDRDEVSDPETPDSNIFHVNDDLGHKLTIKMFNLAIRTAKKDGK